MPCTVNVQILLPAEPQINRKDLENVHESVKKKKAPKSHSEL